MKKFLCVFISIVIVISVSVISASAKILTTVENAMKYWESEYGYEVPTTTYYFYLPEEWKNEHNDYYDGTEESYAVGVTWYGVSHCAPTDYVGIYPVYWPAYAVVKKDAPNVYVAEVPDDVFSITLSNAVYVGYDESLSAPDFSYKTIDTPTSYENADDYGFYPNGLESTSDMIFVVDHNSISEQPFTGETLYGGAWFYYYGNGEYGYAPNKEEAGAYVFHSGEFPVLGELPTNPPLTEPTESSKSTESTEPTSQTEPTIQTEPIESTDPSETTKPTDSSEPEKISIADGKLTFSKKTYTYNGKKRKPNVTVEDKNGKKVTSNNYKITYKNNKKAGTATVIVKGKNDYEGKIKATFKIFPKVKSSFKIVVGETLKLNAKAGKKIKYTSSKKKIVKVNNKGIVTALKAGKATITLSAGGVTTKTKIRVITPNA